MNFVLNPTNFNYVWQETKKMVYNLFFVPNLTTGHIGENYDL